MRNVIHTCALFVAVAAMIVDREGQAASITWNPTASGSPRNWDTNVTGAWQTPVGTKFQTNDTVTFNRSNDTSGGAVFVGTSPTAADVTPASVTLVGGFGAVWTFTGGNILGATTAVNMNQDNTGNFDRDASYSFGGGASINAGGGTLNYRPPTATGAVQFGIGTITIGGGSGTFGFLPGAAGAVLNNNFSVASAGGTLNTNSNSAFNGTVAMNASSGPLRLLGRNVFGGLTFNITGSGTLNIREDFNSANWTIFNGVVNGGGTANVSITNGGGAPTDYYSELGGAGGWNVKNVNFIGGQHTIVPNSATYFSGVAANGGKVYIQGAAGVGIVAPSSGNNGNGTSKSGTYNISADHVVNAQLRAATINVNTGFTVSGKGTLFANTVDVKTGAFVDPGDNVGILTVTSAMNFNPGSTLKIDVVGPNAVAGTDYDRLAVSSNLTGLSGVNLVVDFAFQPFSNIEGDVFTLITSGNNLTGGSFNSVTYVNAPFFYAQVNFGNGFVTLSNFNPVPEPSTALLVGLGAIGLVVKSRRRRVKSEGSGMQESDLKFQI